VAIWDARTNTSTPIQTLRDAKDSVTKVSVLQHTQDQSTVRKSHHQSSNTALIRTASIDGCIRTYDLRQGILQTDQVHSPITGMATTHDHANVAVSCLDGTIRLLDAECGEILNTYRSKHHVAGQYALECSITADDSYIVSGSENGSVVYYDLVRAIPVQVLALPSAGPPSVNQERKPVCSIATHPQLNRTSVVVSAGFDGHGIVWAHDETFMQA
jgi:mitogen-activated protein kinase organizer 1